MFKAFYWMFQSKDLSRTFFKRTIAVLFAALIISAIFCLSCYSIFSNTLVLCGYSGLIFALVCILFITWFIWGHYWELTASIIERKTDILSSTIYGGKVSLVEYIQFPKIEIFKFCWRGFASVIAMMIMELPVFLLALSNVLFYNSKHILLVLLVQILIWIFTPGLFWNYAKNNSIFSMLNIYVAGYLIENHPLRYIWNCILCIVNYILYYALIIAIAMAFQIPLKPDLSSYYNCMKFIGFELIALIPLIYMLHVQAYLVGTLSPKDDY